MDYIPERSHPDRGGNLQYHPLPEQDHWSEQIGSRRLTDAVPHHSIDPSCEPTLVPCTTSTTDISSGRSALYGLSDGGDDFSGHSALGPKSVEWRNEVVDDGNAGVSSKVVDDDRLRESTCNGLDHEFSSSIPRRLGQGLGAWDVFPGMFSAADPFKGCERIPADCETRRTQQPSVDNPASGWELAAVSESRAPREGSTGNPASSFGGRRDVPAQPAGASLPAMQARLHRNCAPRRSNSAPLFFTPSDSFPGAIWWNDSDYWPMRRTYTDAIPLRKPTCRHRLVDSSNDGTPSERLSYPEETVPDVLRFAGVDDDAERCEVSRLQPRGKFTSACKTKSATCMLPEEPTTLRVFEESLGDRGQRSTFELHLQPEVHHAGTLNQIRQREGELQPCGAHFMRYLEMIAKDFGRNEKVLTAFQLGRHELLVYESGIWEVNELKDGIRFRGSGNEYLQGEWQEMQDEE